MQEPEFTYNTNTRVQQSLDAVKTPEVVFEPYDILPAHKISKDTPKNFEFNSVEDIPETIASRLIETANTARIFGISAPQCGINYNIFVVGSDDNFVAFFNPEIILSSEDQELGFEIDASNPGLMLNVKRYKSINVRYQDYTGESKIARFDGITARIIQQNVDRLHCIDFKSKVSKLSLDRQQKALTKKVKKYVKSHIKMVEPNVK